MTAFVLLAMTLSPSLNPPQPDAAHLQRELQRLPEGLRVLYVAAHPDDENTRLLAWLVQEKKARAAYLAITRGDGGQNLIGKEQGPALGAIRTQELLAARRLDGAEQFFTRARDFGFSKSPEETLRFWGHERILEDVVQVIRTFQPDVIITRFSPGPADTHGHHTASAQLAVEAFSKAADPAYLPSVLKPWQAKRVVWNSWETQANAISLQANPYDPLLGMSMGELAGDSRTMHKSQGFGASRSVTPATEWFTLLAGEPMKESPFDGVAPRRADPLLARALREFEPEQPWLAIPALLEAYSQNPRPEIAEAIVHCAGLVLLAQTEQKTVVAGGTLPLTLYAFARNAQVGLELSKISLGSGAQVGRSNEPNSAKTEAQVGPGKLQGLWQMKVPNWTVPAAESTDPAWLREPPQDGYYDVPALEDRIRPEPLPTFWADFQLSLDGTPFTVRRPIVQRAVDPVLGDRTRALELAPPATIDAAAPVLLFPDDGARVLRVTVRASAGPVSGVAFVAEGDPVVTDDSAHPRRIVDGFSVEPSQVPFSLQSGEQEIEFRIKPVLPDAHIADLKLAVKVNGQTYDRGVRRVEYPHIPPQVWHPRSTVRAVRVDLRRGNTRSIGYVAGAGDDVAPVLAQLGYAVTFLDEGALRNQDLRGFDAIVLGVRAYNVNGWMASLKPRLFAYVEQGGVLVTQYNTKNWISNVSEPLGPYPMSISQKRVTDETAEVTLADDPILRAPNRIGAQDFLGWIQERGLYFAGEWDAQKYRTPLSMHDPNEEPLQGSLLIARHGKGRFVYTGLAFFRELPAGVPGSMRLFANLLARDADTL